MPAFLRLHRRQHGGNAVEHAFDIDVDHLVPLVHFQRGQRRHRHDTGVVYQHIDAAESLQGGLRQLFHVFTTGDVAGHGHGLAAVLFDVVGQLLQAVKATCTQHQFGALGGQMACGGFAQAAGSAGDDDDFIGDIAHDGFLYC